MREHRQLVWLLGLPPLEALRGGGVGGAAQRRIDAGLATAATYSQARFEQALLAAWRAITGPRWGDDLHGAAR